MTIRVCLAGATGWAGSALARSIARSDAIELVAAISRTHAGRTLGDVLREKRLSVPIYATAQEALAQPCDVFFEYTKPDVAKANVMAALQSGAHVVIGTSGLSNEDYADIARVAEQRQRGVLAVGNFALTVVLLQKFAEMAAKLVLQTSALAFLVVKSIGALYLLYLGVKTLRDHSSLAFVDEQKSRQLRVIFGQGVLSNVTNPKVALFFLAFLPQFVHPERGQASVQMLLLGLIFAGFGLCYLCIIAYSAGRVGGWIAQHPRCLAPLRWATGGIFLGLGLRLAFTERP